MLDIVAIIPLSGNMNEPFGISRLKRVCPGRERNARHSGTNLPFTAFLFKRQSIAKKRLNFFSGALIGNRHLDDDAGQKGIGLNMDIASFPPTDVVHVLKVFLERGANTSGRFKNFVVIGAHHE